MVNPPPTPLDYSWAPPLREKGITEGRHVRIVGIGAGFSGVCLAINAQERLRDYDLQIYEMADDVGGVWHLNRYPGVACDIPAHSYQFSFCENTQWSKFYAPGPEIHRYICDVAAKYNVRSVVKLKHKVTELRWDQDAGKWHVKVEKVDSGEVFEDVADFVVYATGLLSRPIWPTTPGREKYKGIMHHSAGWDIAKEEADGSPYVGKRVGVIGMGSSAIQILPEMQKRASKVYNFGRTQTWLSGVFGAGALAAIGANTKSGANHVFTDEEKAKLRDEKYYREFRDMVEGDLATVHGVTHQKHPMQEAYHKQLIVHMKTLLASKPEIADKILPDFPPGCKRLTPGPGYLEALVADNCEFVSTEIQEFTEKGIKTVDGIEYELDAIVCATGFNTSAIPSFPILGADGINLQDLWKVDQQTYLAVVAPKMPNFFLSLNVQSTVGSGSLLIVMEQQIAYAMRAIEKMQREGYKSMQIKQKPVDAFMRYVDTYFQRTVFATNCKSWYKNGAYGNAKIRTLWPGSSSHAFLALKNPRWEDFDWERADEFEDDMTWLGNGDIPSYLDPAFYIEETRKTHRETVIF